LESNDDAREGALMAKTALETGLPENAGCLQEHHLESSSVAFLPIKQKIAPQ